MPKRIPISTARRIAEIHSLRQVILIGFDGELTHIVTWGATKADCVAAAQAQDFWKGALVGVVRAAERYRMAKAAHREASESHAAGTDMARLTAMADMEREAAAALLKAALAMGDA